MIRFSMNAKHELDKWLLLTWGERKEELRCDDLALLEAVHVARSTCLVVDVSEELNDGLYLSLNLSENDNFSNITWVLERNGRSLVDCDMRESPSWKHSYPATTTIFVLQLNHHSRWRLVQDLRFLQHLAVTAAQLLHQPLQSWNLLILLRLPLRPKGKMINKVSTLELNLLHWLNPDLIVEVETKVTDSLQFVPLSTIQTIRINMVLQAPQSTCRPLSKVCQEVNSIIQDLEIQQGQCYNIIFLNCRTVNIPLPSLLEWLV